MADESAAAPLPMRDAVLRDLLSSGFVHGTTKLNGQALALSSVLIRSFIQEAISRASAEAQDSGDTECEDVHLEKILPQVMPNQFARAPSLFSSVCLELHPPLSVLSHPQLLLDMGP